MKKIFTLFAIFACLPILLSAKGPAVIGGSTYTADTLSHYKVGPGTYYTAIHFYGPKDMRAFYLESTLPILISPSNRSWVGIRWLRAKALPTWPPEKAKKAAVISPVRMPTFSLLRELSELRYTDVR